MILNLIRLSEMLVNRSRHIFTYPTICIELDLSLIISAARSQIDFFYSALISSRDVAYLIMSLILVFTLALIDLPAFMS